MPSPNDVDPHARVPRPGTGYPTERSFVVQLRSDAAPGRGVVCGRVEHVGSSRAAVFASLDELARFFGEAIGDRA